MKDRDEKLTEQLSFRVTPTLHSQLTVIAKADRRKISEVATALLERGVAAFQRDGHLFEDKTDAVTPIEGHKMTRIPPVGTGKVNEDRQKRAR
jgi:hypothetical protein